MVKTIHASVPMPEATRPATPRPQLTKPISFWNPFVTQPIFFAVDLANTVCMKPLVMNMMPAGKKNIQANAFSLKVGSDAPQGVVQFRSANTQAKTNVSGTNKIPMCGNLSLQVACKSGFLSANRLSCPRHRLIGWLFKFIPRMPTALYETRGPSD